MRPTTLGALKQSGYRTQPVKEEIRRNLLRQLREGEDLFPGIIGFEETVIPQIVNALLSRHDLVLLGLRGQAKSRLLRMLTRFLDEAVPAVAGCPIHDDPFHPLCARCQRIIREQVDDTPLVWLERDQRYNEKLATPDVSVADLIGDIDPIKASREQRDFSDPEVIHFGIIPRTHRGIFSINELPDLQPRIQVALLNIMEERDIQIRGFPIRLPLDVFLAFTANPEDYTHRGNIITPLKDRIASQIITHYPQDVEHAISITSQEAWLEREVDLQVPQLYRELIEEIAFAARESEFVDQSSGVSARLTIAAMENLVSNMEKRAVRLDEHEVYPRICDLYAVLPAMTGKMELVYEGEKEGAISVSLNIIGHAVRRVFARYLPPALREETADEDDFDWEEELLERQQRRRRQRLRPEPQPQSDEYRPIIGYFQQESTVELSDAMPFQEYLRTLKGVQGLEKVARQYLKPADERELAMTMEFVLEGLHQHSLIAKESLTQAVRYRDMLASMLQDL